MFRSNVCAVVFGSFSVCACSPHASAEIIGSGRVTMTYDSGPHTDPSRRILAFGFDTAPPSNYDDPRLFSTRSLSFSQSGGAVLVATATSDPFFNAFAAQLTDGTSQNVISVHQWSPSSFGFANGWSGIAEPQFFRLPIGTSDFSGSTIRSLGLQINLFDEFNYTKPDTNQPAARYPVRCDAARQRHRNHHGAADAGRDRDGGTRSTFRVTYGDTLLLDASKSLGDVAQYQWDLNRDGVYDITTTDAQTLLTPEQYGPFLRAGTSRSVTLQVTDAGGNTSVGTSDTFAYVPEPSTAILLAGVVGALGLTRPRRVLS